jgi:hypothetical protein
MKNKVVVDILKINCYNICVISFGTENDALPPKRCIIFG